MKIEQVYSELILRINHLTELYQQVESHISDTFSWFWAVLIGVFAVIGVALYFLARTLSKDGVDKAISGIDAKLSNLQNELDENNTKLKAFEFLLDGYRTVEGEREYLIPPLYPFVEYRTAERFAGNKVVYTMLIQTGFVGPQWTEMSTNITDADMVLRTESFFYGDSKNIEVSHRFKDDVLWIHFDSKEKEHIQDSFAQIWYTKKQ